MDGAASAGGDSSSREQRLKSAQERLEQAAREVAELSVAAGNGIRSRIHIVTGGDGPMLGISIDTADQRTSSATEGVRVVSVSPGGPAAAAGLKSNDVIKTYNGKSLKRSGTLAPSEVLVAAIKASKADEAIDIDFERDGKSNKAKITPRAFSTISSSIAGLPETLALGGNAFVDRLFSWRGSNDSGFGGAELAELSPALGKYFGTDKGLLVVRAPSDEKLKLQDGDVILDIDGRAPTSVSHAYQILNSYRAGESLKLHIMRQQKRVELQVTMTADAVNEREMPVPAVRMRTGRTQS
jgi:S1-C subfamily serine protease